MDRQNLHIPVMKAETTDLLNIRPDGVYGDLTMGYGGHGRAILEKLGQRGKYLGIDKDGYAIEKSKEWTKGQKATVFIVQDDYKNLPDIARTLNIEAFDGLLIDMGVSSIQLDQAERGFSYHREGMLDMRMNQEEDFSAYDIVNKYGEEEIAEILFSYGEERHAKLIARQILKKRQEGLIQSTLELAEIVKKAYPPRERFQGKHPARKTFQALRIAVNKELDGLEEALKAMAQMLNKDGILAVITFHSLEDRIVKETFWQLANPCTCPPDFPVCTCGAKEEFRLLTKKPILPSKKEMEINHRSRSAKLRGLLRISSTKEKTHA